MKKADLDKRICDCEKGASNTETYREFMINAIREIYGNDATIPDFNSMPEEVLIGFLDELDELLTK